MEIHLADAAKINKPLNTSEILENVGGGFELKVPVDAEFRIHQQAADVYSMSGSLKALAETACNRCGKLTPVVLEQHFKYVLRVEAEPDLSTEYQCSDEDCETLFLAESSLDSHEILREQILLAIPLRQLCNESCKGLCKKCGVNLNNKKCQCGEINENSPFAILKTLQQN